LNRTISLSFLCLLLFISVVQAQVPAKISYQGVINDSDGKPVPDNNYNLTFSIYTAPDAAESVWSEMQPVTVVKGIFNVILGSVEPFPLEFDQQYWLGIQIGTAAQLQPRIELTSVAYSLTARSVEDGAIVTSKIAEASVTASKISTSAEPSTLGQVLTWNGSGLSWQVPPGDGGLTLPYSGEANQGNAAFSVSNNSSDAIRGFTQNGNGVYGFSAGGGNGISGYSETGHGVIGFSNTGISGVYGESKINGGAGVWGVNTSGAGSSGVWGESPTGMGIRGSSTSGTAVYGSSSSGYGIRGLVTQSGTGVYGENTSNSPGAGVQGRADYINSVGVQGTSTAGTGVRGTSGSSTGVAGVSTSGIGVYGQGPTALKAEGNTLQDIGSGGWVKGMLLIRDIGLEPPSIERCYNGVTGQTSDNCGFTISQPGGAGPIKIGAPFRVVDRFFSVTLLQSAVHQITPSIFFDQGDLFGMTVVVATGIDASFYLIIY
jgi:hypothetical protein